MSKLSIVVLVFSIILLAGCNSQMYKLSEDMIKEVSVNNPILSNYLMK